MRRPAKVPRVSLEKYLEGGAAGRRNTVTTLGDSVRDLGVVRLELRGGPDSEAAGRVDPLEVARLVLEALEEYFGLERGSFSELLGEAVGAGVSGPGGGAPLPWLLALWGGPSVTTLEARLADGSTLPVGAREGELVVFAGEGLATLTGGVVPRGRWSALGKQSGGEADAGAGEQGGLFLVPTASGQMLRPYREFERPG